MNFTWNDYSSKYAEKIEAFLDKEAIKYTSCEDGFNDFYTYWYSELGESNFWCKVILIENEPIAVIALAKAPDNVFTIQEFIVSPNHRGKGYGSAILKEILMCSNDIIGQDIYIAEAVIYPDNIASQKAFQKAGFVYTSAHPDGDAWYYQCRKIMDFNYKKVIVLGNNGSGKSYFSRKLAEITGLPLIHLDLLYWKENWTHPNREEWAEIQRKLVASEQWIIDGMHISTLEIRFKEADAIYFLDVNADICLESVRQRKSQERTDFPNYLDKQNGDFDAFTQGVLEFEEKRKPRIIELHNKYPNKDFIVFKTRKEIDDYLSFANNQ